MPQRRGTMPISDADVIYCPDTYAHGVPHECLARLRARTPVTWIDGRIAGGSGLWVVLRHADARRVLRRSTLFGPPAADPAAEPAGAPGGRHDAAHDGDAVPHAGAAPYQAIAPHQAAAPHEAIAPHDVGRHRPAASPADVESRARALLDRIAVREPADFVAACLTDSMTDSMTGRAGRLPGALRDALAGGLYALLRHPDQYARLREATRERPGHHGDLLDSTVEEMLRWWTPVVHVRRRVRRNTAVGGVPLRAGERVAVWLASVDHDEEVFAEPARFDFGRRPNHHLAFGHRPRACPAARTVRAHLRAMLAALLDRPGRAELAGEPIRLRSNTRNGFTHLPVRWRR